MSNDDLKLLEMALWAYVTLFAGGTALFFILQMVGEARQRRRIRKILERRDF